MANIKGSFLQKIVIAVMAVVVVASPAIYINQNSKKQINELQTQLSNISQRLEAQVHKLNITDDNLRTLLVNDIRAQEQINSELRTQINELRTKV